MSRISSLVYAVSAALLLSVASAQAASWQVDPAKSHLGFVGKWSGEDFAGTFHKWNADVVFDPNSLATSKVVVTIDLSSMTSDEGEKELETGMRGPLGFDLKNTPTATFTTKSFRSLGPNRYEAVGDLSLKGITKEIKLPFTLTIQQNVATMKGEAAILRTDFNVGTGIWAAADPVAHEVRVTMNLSATAKP